MAAYNPAVEAMRPIEYPMLKGKVYLDHAGTTPPATSLVDTYAAELKTSLLQNPHSQSSGAHETSMRVDSARLRLLRFFDANPDDFDLVFVANATAGMKLVMETFQNYEAGFTLAYHKDSHTSMVGMREVANEAVCFRTDQDAELYIRSRREEEPTALLFAYPAQSNMNGRRLPLHWPGELRRSSCGRSYSLLDAAAYAATAQLDLSRADEAADFTVVSLYKIFGYPYLGALIIRKQATHVFKKRCYFGGGTVELALTNPQFHARKHGPIHEQLEDGTLPIANIVAVHAALDTHKRLFGGIDHVSGHCQFLTKMLFDALSPLRHGNGMPVCQIYTEPNTDYSDPKIQGPIIAFNLKNHLGGWVSNSELERLAAVKGISLRTGGLCNPGGITSYLNLSSTEILRNFADEGLRCGAEKDIIRGKPMGVARASFGAMSSIRDVKEFLAFVQEFFVDEKILSFDSPPPSADWSRFRVESLTVYPIKSCGGWTVPSDIAWPIHKEGLEWDREWCLVQAGSGVAMSQKRFPRMALIKPAMDLEREIMRVSLADESANLDPIEISLAPLFNGEELEEKNMAVCGDKVTAGFYNSPKITAFFTQALGMPCQLARFPGYSVIRHHRAQQQVSAEADEHAPNLPGAFPQPAPAAHPIDAIYERRLRQGILSKELDSPPIMFSNESPVLLISRSSLSLLNGQIKEGGGEPVTADVFRANIVIAETPTSPPVAEEPYAEDAWHIVAVGKQVFKFGHMCRRCQVVCTDQDTGTRRGSEPLATLAKTRRFKNGVYFGQHCKHLTTYAPEGSPAAQNPAIQVGEVVLPLTTRNHYDSPLQIRVESSV